MPRLSFASFSVAVVRVAAAGVGVSLLLSGCQGGNPPGRPPSESGSTTASPTSGATGSPSPVGPSATTAPSGVYKPADAKGKAQNVPVPVMPELAKENSKAGLEAFIRYWYATYSYALETGDLSAWSRNTDMSVPVAIAHRESVELNYVEGRWMAGGRITTPVIEVLWSNESKPLSAKVQVVQEQIQYFDADGSKGQDSSLATNTADAVFASYIDGEWRVTDYGTIVG